MDIVDAAHLFAIGNIVTTDAGIACYDSKFFYQFWRPISGDPERRQGQQPRHDRRPELAVAAAGAGPPRIPVDARLLHHRLRRHARGGAAHAASRRDHARRRRADATTLTTTQHFNTVKDIENQVVDARVWLGFHFRNSVEQGLKVGNNVADWELDRYFKPVH